LKSPIEAEAIDATLAPGAVVHTSYYAMFHAAVAFIYFQTGSAPTKHDQVIGEFGRLLKGAPENERAHGRAFNRLKDLRESDDYDWQEAIESTEAESARQIAIAFLEYVRTTIGL
jgi:uncharacterized protein (UPF0332 family)